MSFDHSTCPSQALVSYLENPDLTLGITVQLHDPSIQTANTAWNDYKEATSACPPLDQRQYWGLKWDYTLQDGTKKTPNSGGMEVKCQPRCHEAMQCWRLARCAKCSHDGAYRLQRTFHSCGRVPGRYFRVWKWKKRSLVCSITSNIVEHVQFVRLQRGQNVNTFYRHIFTYFSTVTAADQFVQDFFPITSSMHRLLCSTIA